MGLKIIKLDFLMEIQNIQTTKKYITTKEKWDGMGAKAQKLFRVLNNSDVVTPVQQVTSNVKKELPPKGEKGKDSKEAKDEKTGSNTQPAKEDTKTNK